ncbi:MAG TPA: MBL fold metallo-hydrolase, partial [Ramlibacter sp.]|nr:MBL fold metallo-hydrolase [Ramlibacter sp.]
GDKSGKYPDGNQVVVQGRHTRAAFDTPLVANRIGPAFDDVDLVILGHVHEDHMAGLHRVPQAQVHVHQADLAAARSWEGLSAHYGYEQPVLERLKVMIERDFHYRPRPDAIGYADARRWELGGATVRAHHLPGHTSGHCALVVEEEGVAFIGDIDLTGFGPYYGDGTSSLAQLRQSLREVAQLDAKVWVTSHHRAVLTERKAFDEALARFAAKVDERSERLLGWLAEGPQELDQLARRGLLYPPGHEAAWTLPAERNTVRLHLEELMAQGLVRQEGALFS